MTDYNLKYKKCEACGSDDLYADRIGTRMFIICRHCNHAKAFVKNPPNVRRRPKGKEILHERWRKRLGKGRY